MSHLDDLFFINLTHSVSLNQNFTWKISFYRKANRIEQNIKFEVRFGSHLNICCCRCLQQENAWNKNLEYQMFKCYCIKELVLILSPQFLLLLFLRIFVFPDRADEDPPSHWYFFFSYSHRHHCSVAFQLQRR